MAQFAQHDAGYTADALRSRRVVETTSVERDSWALSSSLGSFGNQCCTGSAGTGARRTVFSARRRGRFMDTTTEFVSGPTTETITAFPRSPNDGLVGAQNAADLPTKETSRHR